MTRMIADFLVGAVTIVVVVVIYFFKGVFKAPIFIMSIGHQVVDLMKEKSNDPKKTKEVQDTE